MRHVEVWSEVRQKGTVCASRKICTGLKGSVTKSCKFISWGKDHKQRTMFCRYKQYKVKSQRVKKVNKFEKFKEVLETNFKKILKNSKKKRFLKLKSSETGKVKK